MGAAKQEAHSAFLVSKCEKHAFFVISEKQAYLVESEASVAQSVHEMKMNIFS